MRKSAVFRSVMRQPVRGIVLLVLVAAMAFAFVSRTVEYVVVNAELDRIEQFYRSIGVLTPIEAEDITKDHNVAEAAALFALDDRVAINDTRRFVQGVTEGMINDVNRFVRGNSLNLLLHGSNVQTVDFYFLGTVRRRPAYGLSFFSPHDVFVSVIADYIVAGDPRFMRTEPLFIEVGGRNPRVITVYANDVNIHLPIVPGTPNPLADLRVGSQYLFRVTRMDNPNPERTASWILLPLLGDYEQGDVFRPWLRNSFPPASPYYPPAPALFFVSTDDEEAMAAVLAKIQPNIDTLNENLHSIMVVGTKDMSSMPIADAGAFRLTDGRFLNHDDHVNQNPVAVVTQAFALRNNLSVGDNFTVNLRDLPIPTWFEAEELTGRWADGREGWWDIIARPWWVTIESTVINPDGTTAADPNFWHGFPTHELELSVAGIYRQSGTWEHINNYHGNEIFVPASIMPPDFGWDILLNGMYSFVLNSPRNEDAFLADYGEALEEMGFTISFISRDPADFWASADPIRLSLFVNLVIFSIVAVLILALIVFLYIRQCRRAFAISRALGITSVNLLGEMTAPVLFFSLPAILAGSLAAWIFALAQARTALAAVGEYSADFIGINIIWFFAIAFGIGLTVTLAILLSGLALARKTPLELLLGRAKKSKIIPDTDPVPTDFNIARLNFEYTPTSKSAAGKNITRFIFRSITRSPVRSILATGLALFFLVSLGWLRGTIAFNEAEIERLFDTTVVTAEIIRVPDPEDDSEITALGLLMGSFLTQESLDALVGTGFIQSMYLEAGWPRNIILGSYPPDFRIRRNPADVYLTGMNWIYGISCLNEFIYDNIRTPADDQFGTWGTDISIEFAEGFGTRSFDDWDTHIPIIVSHSMLDWFGLTLGQEAFALYPETALHGNVRIIGVYSGGLSRGILRFREDTVIMPINALEQYLAGEFPMHYMTARLNLDPARNRELDNFAAIAENILSQNAPLPPDLRTGEIEIFPMLLDLDDAVLRNVIEPMERNLSLLRILYPIAISLSFVMALGLSLLLIVQNAKNAAILRSLGVTAGTTRLISGAEQIINCVAGLILGVVVLLIIGVGLEGATLLLGGLYFSGAAAGTLIGAIVITSRPPLDLLQVKE